MFVCQETTRTIEKRKKKKFFKKKIEKLNFFTYAWTMKEMQGK